MNTVNLINVIDGNQYIVSNSLSGKVTDETFDSIYKELSVDDDLESYFKASAKKYNINENLLKAVAKAESGFDKDAVSYCGAQGIMQLMPFVSEEYGVTDPFDPVQSIDAGANLLSKLLDNYNGNVTLALAAYNAGSGSVERYGGVPPYSETLGYIDKINDLLNGALDNDSRTIEGSEKTEIPVGDIDVSENDSLISPVYDADESRVFSYNDYDYFISTYKEIFMKIFSSNELSDNDNIAVRLYNEYIQNAGTISNAEDVLFDKNKEDLTDKAGVYYYQSQANYNFLNNSFDNIANTDAQALYQAQASVVSPLVQKLLNL